VVRTAAGIACLGAALSLGACSGTIFAMPDFESFRPPDTSTLFRPYSVTSYKEKPLPPVTAEDLVDQDGRCAVATAPAAEQPAGEQATAMAQPESSPTDAGLPQIPGGIALDMTECDVVKRAGIPQRVEIGSEGGERRTTITFLGGLRPGIYHFAGGRLRSMDRAPEPPPQPKPTRRAPKRTATR
jgi:hypothetical protein